MEYLFGDATPSPLDRNYIDYLRDLLELTASLLAAHAETTKLARDAHDRELGASIVSSQLQDLGTRLKAALDGFAGPQLTSMASQAVDNMQALCVKELQRAEAELASTLSSDLGRIQQAITAEHAKYHGYMQKLLLKHDLPECTQRVGVRLDKDGAYQATLTGHASCGVSWIVELSIPAGHLFGEALRVERVAPQLAVQLPQESGWVRKSVKLRTHKLGNLLVAEILRTRAHTAIRLRVSSQEDAGFDLVRPAGSRSLQVLRVDKGVADEPYEPDGEDARALQALWSELLKASASLQDCRSSLLDGRFEGVALREMADPTELVRRLIAQAAPVVREIARHSLSPKELVLKRVLADDRREEIFASKADLRDQIAPLPAKLRKMFDPLGLDDESDPRPSGAGPASRPQPSDPLPDEPPTRLVAPLPKPSTPPPPRRRKTKPGVPPAVPAQPTPPPKAAAGSPPTAPGDPQTGDSVEVPLDELESK